MINKINSYDRFKRYFRKGEQICIYGYDWDTFGYINNIEKDGVSLVQIRNKKEIKYSWSCFEVVFHSGVKVNKEKKVDPILVTKFKIITDIVFGTMPISIKDFGLSYKLVNTDKKYFIFYSSLNFQIDEITPENQFAADSSFMLHPKLLFEIKGIKETYESDHYTKCSNIKEIHSYIFPIINNKIEGTDLFIRNDIEFQAKNSGKKFEIKNDKDLKKLRKDKMKEKPYVYSGDPVLFEGNLIDYKTWENKNGIVMGNFFADIYI